jgi:hypothetical protein
MTNNRYRGKPTAKRNTVSMSCDDREFEMLWSACRQSGMKMTDYLRTFIFVKKPTTFLKRDAG